MINMSAYTDEMSLAGAEPAMYSERAAALLPFRNKRAAIMNGILKGGPPFSGVRTITDIP